MLLILGCAVAVVALMAPAAVAAPPPRCWDPELWARPGIERAHHVWCEFVDSVAVATPPQHGSLEGLVWDGWQARFRYRPDDDAPATDTLELALSGPGGSTTVALTIHVVPLSVNSAPWCTPIADARRSDGAAPVEFLLSAMCFDNEHDSVTLHGAGPGTHLDDPTVITGGHGSTHNAFMRYRTAAADGAELATYWAVDDLGARSPDAGISLAVGPGINRLPACRPNPQIGPAPPYVIRMRSGMTRNFGILCEDADGDAFTPTLGVVPQHGAFTTFAAASGLPSFPGRPYEHLVDATYVPETGALGPDRFTVVAAASPSDRSETPMELVPVPAGENGSHGCSWSGATTPVDTPALVTLQCDDGEGDPLLAQVTRPPDHGSADPPAVVPGRFGLQDVVVRYVPAPGFQGMDTIGITVSDGASAGMELVVSITVTAKPPPPQPMPPPGPGRPAPGQALPLAPVDQARTALGMRGVKLVGRAGVARIYAPARGVRGGRPGLAVTCDLACRVDARRKGRRATQRIAIRPGGAGVITAPRRVRAKQLAYVLRIRTEGHATRRAVVRVRVRR